MRAITDQSRIEEIFLRVPPEEALRLQENIRMLLKGRFGAVVPVKRVGRPPKNKTEPLFQEPAAK